MQMGVHVHVGLQVPELPTQPGGQAHLGQQERSRRATYPGAAQTGIQVIYEASPKSSVQVRLGDGVEALRTCNPLLLTSSDLAAATMFSGVQAQARRS